MGFRNPIANVTAQLAPGGTVGVENVAATSLASSGFAAAISAVDPFPGPFPWVMSAVAAPAFFQGFMIEVDGVVNGGVLLAAVANDTGWILTGFAQDVGNTGSARWLLPRPGGAGDQLIAAVGLLSGSTSSTTGPISCTAVHGVDMPQLRDDGRFVPGGQFAADIPVGSMSGEAVAGPSAVSFGSIGNPTPSIMVAGVVPPVGVQSSGSLVGRLTGTVGGAVRTIAAWGWDTSPREDAPVMFPTGIRLDKGAALNFEHSAAPGAGALPGMILYDLVL